MTSMLKQETLALRGFLPLGGALPVFFETKYDTELNFQAKKVPG